MDGVVSLDFDQPDPLVGCPDADPDDAVADGGRVNPNLRDRMRQVVLGPGQPSDAAGRQGGEAGELVLIRCLVKNILLSANESQLGMIRGLGQRRNQPASGALPSGRQAGGHQAHAPAA